MAQFDKNKTADALEAKGALRACPACGTKAGFQIVPGFSPLFLEQNSEGEPGVSEGPSVQTVAANCKHCGHIMRFAAQTLGLV